MDEEAAAAAAWLELHEPEPKSEAEGRWVVVVVASATLWGWTSRREVAGSSVCHKIMICTHEMITHSFCLLDQCDRIYRRVWTHCVGLG
jgi:hypothetical protein